MNTAARGTGGSPQHWLSFHLGGQLYAAPLSQVSEVIRVGEVTPVPGSAPDLLGVRHLRGHIVPVMDGRARLGLPAGEASHQDGVRIVVLTHGSHWVGLRVDAVGELLLPADDGIGAPPPDRAVRENDPVYAILAWRGGFVALLDVGQLCRLPELDAG
jgi:purine-binding chemotaxis protein CheW